MRKTIKQALLGLAVVLVIVISVVTWAFYPQVSNLKSEYTTAAVIRDLDAYVVSHPGEWPRSWKDLGDGTDRSAFTMFRFDLSVDSLRQHPELIYEAATPIRGRYLTYPHAKRELGEVLKKLKLKVELPAHDRGQKFRERAQASDLDSDDVIRLGPVHPRKNDGGSGVI